MTVDREETEIELLAYRLAGAELNYRIAYEKFGDGHIETGRCWDKMRRAGNAIRDYEPQEQSEHLSGCRDPDSCQRHGECMYLGCPHYGKTECRPRMTVLAQVDGIVYPKVET